MKLQFSEMKLGYIYNNQHIDLNSGSIVLELYIDVGAVLKDSAELFAETNPAISLLFERIFPMARNSSGTYSLPENPLTTHVVLDGADVQTALSDIATALTGSLARNGSATATGDQPMDGFRHLNVGLAVARDEYATAAQVQDNAFAWCGLATGTPNAVTLTPALAISAYVAGQVFFFQSIAANTGPVTVAVSGLSPAVVQYQGAALASGQLEGGRLFAVIYDGVRFRLQPLSGLLPNSITESLLVDGSVTASKIAPAAVGTAALADDAVTTAKIAPDAVTAAEIAAGAVGTAALADDAVTTVKIAPDAVTAAEIAAGAVGTAELADDAVTTAKIAPDAVTAVEIAAGAVGTTELVDASVTLPKLDPALLNLPQPNLLVNGAMRIAQRGPNFSIQPGGYTLDRWFVNRDQLGSNLTASLATVNGPGFGHALRLVRTTGDISTSTIAMAQAMESIDSVVLRGQSVVFSFYYQSGAGASGSLTLAIITGTGTDESPGASFTGQQIFSGTPIAMPTGSSWQRADVTAVLPANLNQVRVQIGWAPTGTAAANSYIDITGAQLEVGTQATPFKHESFGIDLIRCQRYFNKSYDVPVTPGSSSGTGWLSAGSQHNSSTSLNTRLYYGHPTTMRAAPTVTFYNVAGSSNIWDGAQDTNALSIGMQGVAIEGHMINTFDGRISGHIVCDAEL